MTQPMDTIVYVASLNGGKSEGILSFTLDFRTGGLQAIRGFREGVQNPLYLATDPQQRFLYAADFVESCDGKPGGAVSAYAIDPGTGTLKFLNRRSSEGTVPCYVSVAANGRSVLVANYTSGTVAALRVGNNGELGEPVSVEQHTPGADAPKRQPHAHSIVLDAANRFAFAGELGLDKVMIYRFDAAMGKLTPSGAWASREGAGPRHFTFHPNGRFAYLINEHGNTVVAFAYDAAAGKLTELQTLPTLPQGFEGKSYTADLHVHRSGRFLYGSNRGHDSIVIFAIDAATGQLKLVGHQPTQGNFPRGFGIDPSGTFLLAANEKSDSIVTFRIDQKSGALTPTGHTTKVPAPACICFVTSATRSK